MATLARQLQSPDPFTSKSRPVLSSAADFLSPDNMHVYGQIPTCEHVSHAVCNVCGPVVKLVVFPNRYERRHGSASGSRAPLVPLKAKMSLSQSEVEPLPFRVPRDYPHSRFNKAPLAVYPPKGARTKACVSLPVVSLEKMPCFSRSEGAQIKVSSTPSAAGSSLSVPSSSSASSSPSSSSLKSTLTSPASCRNQEKLVNGRGIITPRSTTPPLLTDRRPSPSQSSPLDKRLTASPSSQDRRPATSPSPSSVDRRPGVSPSPPERKHLNGAKSSSHRRVSGRVYDPNKHCGVMDPESKRPCTRSLTCKTHSLTHRRTVPGRKKGFDILLAEHKGRAKEKDAGPKRDAASSQSAHPTQPLGAPSSTPSGCHNGKTTPTLKLRLASTHLQRGSGGGGAVVLCSTSLPAIDQIPSCQRYGGDVHESSDEAEAEVAEELEKTSCHYSSYHPQPISWCAFSSRLMGQGHYVFDRHWDRMRLALHCMVEKHVTAQMWRKVPLAADSMPSMSDSSSLSMSLLPSPTPPLDSVSTVSCSTPFSQNGTRIFCLQESKLQLNKAAKSLKTSAEGVLLKKHKPLPVAEKRNGSGYHLSGPVHVSNGTAALSMRSKPNQPGGSQGLSDMDRHTSIELNLPQAPKGNHGSVLSPSLLPCGSTEGRKRKTSGSERAGKVTKTTAHNEIFRKSSTALLSSAAEASHSALSRLSKVHE
ncbi:ataxin-7-like protein 1 isoform X1 [Ictalurus punctatus]|uniref:Ataxin-7-like protein 1 isoform X1 n=3 Tax=Ictalurus punctatus TaxID=7998 RepID=A0A2D0T4S0_ICTPU|nr:ataxin-7-like protein 1 isoform X1 [Ictalurus punctatus]